uniref:Uncharacterized protein n=1 Tax=Timema tahoe TaxID=61484 RepID=A0A7R9IIF4_9NEOP|nr:unnamed protein product [Timema tahoe]
MVTSINDKLLGPKLAFFKTLALEVEPILVAFQVDAPMAPFLYTDLTNMVTSVMRRFVKKEEESEGDDYEGEGVEDDEDEDLGEEEDEGEEEEGDEGK